MSVSQPGLRSGAKWTWLFALTQVAVMLLAISNESLWIDEFWTEHFGAMGSFKDFYELLIVPSGSQTPLHFLHFYLWGQLHLAGEFLFRLANLPLFVAGQLALYWALRDQQQAWTTPFLVLSALHPMVWQYANEARPYIMMLAGSQMILAYLLRLHISATHGRPTEPLFLVFFALGGVLLFGSSMLGAFWVLAAGVQALVHHLRRSTWRELLQGFNPLLVAALLLATGVLTAYYLSSLLKGAGGSRLATSSLSTVAFAAYEMLGLSGLGPSRLDLRALGLAALRPHAVVLATTSLVLLWLLAQGLQEARRRLGSGSFWWLVGVGLFPVAVVLLSGFAMHWRVLGRHLIAALPLLNLLLAMGMVALWQNTTRWRLFSQLPLRPYRWLVALGLLALVVSSLAQRFSQPHRKDDYRAAAQIAQAALQSGQRVWWAAGVIGARYYGLPGEFNVMAELTSQDQALRCSDSAGVEPVANAKAACLARMTPPDVVILSKPETFDVHGDIAAYLRAQQFVPVQALPAFTIWRRQVQPLATKP